MKSQCLSRVGERVLLPKFFLFSKAQGSQAGPPIMLDSVRGFQGKNTAELHLSLKGSGGDSESFRVKWTHEDGGGWKLPSAAKPV